MSHKQVPSGSSAVHFPNVRLAEINEFATWKANAVDGFKTVRGSFSRGALDEYSLRCCRDGMELRPFLRKIQFKDVAVVHAQNMQDESIIRHWTLLKTWL